MDATVNKNYMKGFIPCLLYTSRSAELGVDVVDLSRGNSLSFATVYEVPPYLLEPGFNMENIARIKSQISIPVMGVGRVNTPEPVSYTHLSCMAVL